MIKLTARDIIKVDDIFAVSEYSGKKLIAEVKEKKALGQVRDMTRGKRTMSVVILENGTFILSNLSMETIRNRIEEAAAPKQSVLEEVLAQALKN